MFNLTPEQQQIAPFTLNFLAKFYELMLELNVVQSLQLVATLSQLVEWLPQYSAYINFIVDAANLGLVWYKSKYTFAENVIEYLY